MTTHRRIVLARRPNGAPTLDDFRLETVPTPTATDGTLVVRNRWLSLDPYMRGRMNDTRSYAAAQSLDATMIGGTVGEVIESRHPDHRVGDIVVGALGWEEVAVSDGKGLQTVGHVSKPSPVPSSVWLGACGMPGITAWIGLHRFLEPVSGETLLVTSAAGAVGSVVGQLAKRLDLRVVGVAGGAEKCAWVRDTLGFDACLDYKALSDPKAFAAALHEVAPRGVDMVFENVGGPVLDVALSQMNAFGRVAVCGLIAGYNGDPIPLRNPTWILISRLRVQGFIVTEHLDLWPHAGQELAGLVADGTLKYREHVVDGLAQAPAAFLAMLKGEHVGKTVVRLT